MDNSANNRHARSRTSSTGSLRQGQVQAQQQQVQVAAVAAAQGSSSGALRHLPYNHHHHFNQYLLAGTNPLNVAQPVPGGHAGDQQLAGAAPGSSSGARSRCYSTDQLSTSSRGSSIPPTPAPTPNPALHNFHVAHEQLVAGIKQLHADEGYIDSSSFPATPAPSPFSPSPALSSSTVHLSPDQVRDLRGGS